MNTLIPGAPLRSLSPTSIEYQRAQGASRAAKPARAARFTLDAPEHSGTIPGAIGDILPPGVALTSNLAVIFTLNQYSGACRLYHRGRSTSRKEIGLTLKRHFKPTDSIVIGKIGRTGYYSGIHVFDRNGLVDRRVARLPLGHPAMDDSVPMSIPGHDKKVLATFFFPEEPTIVVYAKVSEESGKGSVGWQAKVFAVRFRRMAVWKRYVP